MTEDYVRLHITPFNPSLLNTILPSSILPNARNISYHEIQTFPEKGYGYVDLPTMDAEKIKKKLSGSILKGVKIKIDKARPQKEVIIEETTAEPERPKKEKKKRKRDELSGVDIGERQVKRGWTTPAKDIPKDKIKIVNKSKFTTGPECLFKTNLPPNVASKTKTAEAKVETKRKRKPGKEAVVHEFTKTTKYATFLRSSSGPTKTKTVTEYIEGKGWVDEDGNVVEAALKSKKPKTVPEVEIPAPISHKEPDSEFSSDESEEEEGANLSVEDCSDEFESDEEETLIEPPAKTIPIPGKSNPTSTKDGDEGIVRTAAEEDDSSSSSEESDTEVEDASSSDEATSSEESVDEPRTAPASRPTSSAGLGLTIKIPNSATSTPIASSVHPLEALYKRPKKATDSSVPKPRASSFSFFGGDDNSNGDDDVEAETHIQVPLTPFTQKDFEYRGIRSAAPTPDTAHANKRFIWPSKDDEVDDSNEDEDEDEPKSSSPIRKGKEPAQAEEAKSGENESDFQKWFWENRGNVNRAWKKRKRTVAKETRQRESRKRQHIA